MNISNNTVKRIKPGSAPLKNLAILDSLATMVKERPDHIPGMATFSGPSGFGKSTAAAYVAAHHGAVYIECRSTWSPKAYCIAFLSALGIEPAKTVYGMADQISAELAANQQLIILDEFDNAVNKVLIEITRDIYEQSKAPIILIGEEMLPQKLQKWERFHGRIMRWAKAEPAGFEDARALNSHYAADIKISDDLLKEIVTLARGSARRLVTNIEMISLFARGEGLSEIGKAQWGNQELHSAVPPVARKAF